MGFAEEMLNLGEKLVSSCDARIGGNKNMVRNTRHMINNFHHNNRQMARELKSNLNEFSNNLSSNTLKMRRRFKREHGEMANNQRENLEEFTNGLFRNVGGFLRKCNKTRMGLHNMFFQAHKNFLNCMSEIERKKRHAHDFNFRNESRPHPHKKHAGRKKKRTRH